MFQHTVAIVLQCTTAVLLQSATSAQQTQVYFSTSNTKHIGWENPLAAAGNPLKGLLGSPSFHDFVVQPNPSLDSSMDFYYIGLNDVMKGNPDIVDYDSAFDWSIVEESLETSAGRFRHSVLTFNLHYPNKESNIPQYLLDAGIKTYNTSSLEENGISPDYGDTILLNALRQFIYALGEKYDGDKRIAFIHLGLLGFWGEWHTYPLGDWVPEHAKQSVVQWYSEAFHTTKLQARYPYEPAYQAGMGLYDGSFAFHTLDGDANGGVYQPQWYFWPLVQQASHDDFWRFAPMGGETRPELQSMIFEPTYPAGTYEKQDFVRCVYTTHASYIFHHDAFKNGGYNGAELDKAIAAHARLGYNFIISRVAASRRENDDSFIDIHVDLRQIGVAPFYYDLDLGLDCDGLSEPYVLKGAESLIADMDTETFTFERVPSTALCLQMVTFSLQSSYAFQERPIKFAQGIDGKVALTIPLPNGSQPGLRSDSSIWGVANGFYISKGPGRSFELFSPLDNGQVLDLATFGDEPWTIHANLTWAHSATFRYDGQTHSVSHSSFSLSGDVQGYSRTVNYLKTPGDKRVTVSAFNYEGNVIGYARVDFTIVNSSTTAPTTAVPTHSPTFASKDVDPKDTIASDEPHGFNTPQTPTVLEMNTKDAADTKKKSRQKLGMIFVWTITSLVGAALLTRFISSVVGVRGKTTSEDPKCRSTSSDALETTARAESNDDESGTGSVPSESWSVQSNTIVVKAEDSIAF